MSRAGSLGQEAAQAGAGPGDAALAQALVGTWRLLTWQAIGEDGEVTFPLGEQPEGVLVYTADGTMITTLGSPGRPPIPGGDMLAGPAEERLAAMASFIAFSGSYRVEGGDVIHTIGMSLFPNWVGTQQRRHVRFDEGGSRLTLVADPFPLRGRVASQRLTWERR